jgi:DNA repair exonuclease SbcCD ATPase subunit
MINLDFKYLKAENIFCFGKIEIKFQKFPNITLIKGTNLDVADNEEELVASNGCGKTSIPTCIVYALYGRTIKGGKKLVQDDLINKKVGKKLYVEFQWSKYRVIRTRKPNSLRLWESEEGIWDDNTEITLGGMPATQALIEQKIGLNFDTFINLLIFTDNNAGCFLECDAATKREIVENTMALHEFREDWENAKEEKNSIKSLLGITAKLYEQSIIDLNSAKNRVVTIEEQEKKWKIVKKQELDNLTNDLSNKEKELTETDAGQAIKRFSEAQDRIQQQKAVIPVLEDKQIKIKPVVDEARSKLETARSLKHQITLKIQSVESDLQEADAEVKRNTKVLTIKDKKGTQCPTCFSIINENNYKAVVIKASNNIDHYKNAINLKTTELKALKEKQTNMSATIKKLEEGITIADSKLKDIVNSLDSTRSEINKLSQIQKPQSGVREKVIEEQILETKNKIVAKKTEINGPSPYVNILNNANDEVLLKTKDNEDKKLEVNQLEDDLNYCEYWVNGFSSKGIPKFAISDIIPALNSKIAHWLQFLIDGKIKLVFNDELEENIDRNPSDGDPYVYYAMSGGERRRLNLAVSQAFAHVMMISCNTRPSLVFLDEVTTNVDPIGVVGIYNMILELSKEKQIFITTHDQGLLEMLNGCETIHLQKKDGFTKII